jgi:hypothetical protein
MNVSNGLKSHGLATAPRREKAWRSSALTPVYWPFAFDRCWSSLPYIQSSAAAINRGSFSATFLGVVKLDVYRRALMSKHQIDYETSLIAPELRDKLFRLAPETLNYKFQRYDEDTEEIISDVMDAMICIGAVTPVLLNTQGKVIAWQCFVDASIRIGLDDIYMIDFEALNAEERIICLHSMRDYFEIADLDHDILLLEIEELLFFILHERITLDYLASQDKAA